MYLTDDDYKYHSDNSALNKKFQDIFKFATSSMYEISDEEYDLHEKTYLEAKEVLISHFILCDQMYSKPNPVIEEQVDNSFEFFKKHLIPHQFIMNWYSVKTKVGKNSELLNEDQKKEIENNKEMLSLLEERHELTHKVLHEQLLLMLIVWVKTFNKPNVIVDLSPYVF